MQRKIKHRSVSAPRAASWVPWSKQRWHGLTAMGKGQLDKRHHAFLQALMTRGPLPEDEVASLHRGLFPGDTEELLAVMGAINKELDLVQMELRWARDQNTGVMNYGLVNKLSNAQAKLGTRYSCAQILFFNSLVEAILQNPSGEVSSTEVFNLPLLNQAEAGVKLTFAETDKTLRDLSRDKWLDRRDDGSVCLGVRSFLEFRTAFKNFDVPYCAVCHESAVKAQPCRNDECSVRVHSYCVSMMRKSKKRLVSPVCTGCGTEWQS